MRFRLICLKKQVQAGRQMVWRLHNILMMTGMVQWKCVILRQEHIHLQFRRKRDIQCLKRRRRQQKHFRLQRILWKKSLWTQRQPRRRTLLKTGEQKAQARMLSRLLMLIMRLREVLVLPLLRNQGAAFYILSRAEKAF